MKNLFVLCCIFLAACGSENNSAPAPRRSETSEPNPRSPDTRPEGKLCFLGNTGNGSTEQAHVASAMLQHGCKDIYHLGDLIYPGGIQDATDPLLQTNFFDPYQNLMDQGVHFNLVMGDLDHAGNTDAWMTVADQNSLVIYPGPYYVQKWDDICVVAVDTSMLNDEAQETWLETTLENSDGSCQFIVAMGHHSYLSTGPDRDATGDNREFFESHILAKTDLYVSGQDHILSDEGEVQGTRFLVSGGGGAELDELARAQRDYANSAHGFISVEFRDNEEGNVMATYNVVEVDESGMGTVVHENTIIPGPAPTPDPTPDPDDDDDDDE